MDRRAGRSSALPRFVSRKREFHADELACYVAGGEPMVQGLRKIGAESLAWSICWYSEVAPRVTETWLPPIGEGFKKLLEYSELAEAVNLAAEAQIAKGTTDPYNTHPPMREQIQQQ